MRSRMDHDAASDEGAQHRELVRASHRVRVEEALTVYKLGQLFWAGFGPEYVPVSRDTEVVALNFPKADVSIQSPAFIWPDSVQAGFSSGSSGPTDEATFNQFIHSLAARNRYIEVFKAPCLSDEGRELTYVVLSSSNTDNYDTTKEQPKLRIWLQGGVHGSEPSGDQALLALLGKMDSDPCWTKSILERIVITMVPRCNPDGIVIFSRCYVTGIDPNRDNIRLSASQSTGIRKLFCDFAPHIAVDMHEYSAKAKVGKYTNGSDVMFSAAKNLNIHSNIRHIAENLFAPEVGRRLTKSQFRWEPYIPSNGRRMFFKEAGSDGKIGRNAMGLTQCVSFLCETRGIGIADQYFHRRTAAALTFLESILEIAVENHDVVAQTINEAVSQFTHESEEIIIQDAATMIDRTFTVIHTDSGDLTQLPVRFASTTPTIAVLTRRKPEAYTIPASMSDVINRLQNLGLQLQIMQHERTAIVEKLFFSSVILGSSYDDGVVPLEVATITRKSSVTLQAGSYIVSARQKNAALAFVTLEPENVDSFVSLNIISVVAGDEYPIYRLMEPIET